ncbi:hypothetical protein BD770DRAFT_469218 [Pilaira anomala]|nr:hypothetical protein BD770DRAFT_469218 [Pilaira anomala]
MYTKKHALDDDYESQRNVVTESNVDYLSYKFDEMDLAASWRVLTKQKLNIVNGIRLENASWRTWAKQRNNLKTVSPDTLNWLKDSDVTWLYGPLHTVIKEIGDTDRFAKPKISTTEDTFGLMTTPTPSSKQDSSSSSNSTDQPPDNNKQEISRTRPTASPLQNQKPLKSALKKVTMCDILKRSASELQINTGGVDNQDNISLSEANQQLGAFSPAVIASHRQPKLRFNQYVEQCVSLSLEDNSSKKKSRFQEEEDDEDEDEDETTSSGSYEPGEEESDANSIIVMRRPKVRSSIKKIEPALLKTNSRSDPDLSLEEGSTDDDDDDEIISTLSGHYRPTNKRLSKRRTNYNNNNNNNNNLDWELESAESDALVHHIMNVSKGKQPIKHKDPATERIPIVFQQSEEYWDDDNGSQMDLQQQTKSDYEYQFDDDDWDTHSEHFEDEEPTLTTISTTEEHYQPPLCVVSTPHNESPQLTKASVINKPTNTSSSSTTATTTTTTATTNPSLFTQIAHWASSRFWPTAEN